MEGPLRGAASVYFCGPVIFLKSMTGMILSGMMPHWMFGGQLLDELPLDDGRVLGQRGLADLDALGVALGLDDLLLLADLLLLELVLLGRDVL